MKPVTKVFLVLVAMVPVLTAAGGARAAAGREIPVYPGAALVIEDEGAGPPVCCSFRTKDAAAKVVAFYESHFKQKPLDMKALAARYPDMRAHFRDLERQLPPGSQVRYFVIEEVEFQGKKAAELFGLLLSPGVVNFSLSEEQLGKAGAKYALEHRQKSGAPAGGPDLQYTEWMKSHPVAKAEDYNLPVYPGSRVAIDELDTPATGLLGNEYKSKTCYQLALLTPDPLDKVVTFYRSRLAGQLKPAAPGTATPEGASWGAIQFEVVSDDSGKKHFVRGKRGSVNRLVTIDRAADEANKKMMPSEPAFSSDRRERLAGAPVQATVIAIVSEVLDPACVTLPKSGVQWRENEAPQQNQYR